MFWFTTDLQSHVVLIGQVKQYFAYESQHQHGAIDMTGGFKHFLFSPLPGEMIQFGLFFSDGLKPPTRLREVEVCFLPKNPPCPQTPKKATLMKSLCGWSRQPWELLDDS